MQKRRWVVTKTKETIGSGTPLSLTNSFAVARTLEPGPALVVKLDAWLRVQPEWLAIFALPRSERREIGRALAKHVMTLPPPL